MTDKIDDGGPAFPAPEIRGPNGEGICEAVPGMTIRDYFAAAAMQGIAAIPDDNRTWPKDSKPGESLTDWLWGIWAEKAKLSFLVADAMLKARNP